MASRTTTTKTAGAPKAPAPTKRTSATTDTRPPALGRRATTKAANGIATKASSTPAATDAARTKSGLTKLGKGGLEAPSARRARLWYAPAAMDTTPSRPSTRAGAGRAFWSTREGRGGLTGQ